MLFTKKFINFLSIYQIAGIIESYLISKDPSFLDDKDMDLDAKISILAGMPHWTYLQIIDQYLVCQLGKKQYSVLLRQQEILGFEILPYRFSHGMLYIRKFFEFQLYQRQMGEDAIKELINRANTMQMIKVSNELSYLKQLIRLIQEYELFDENPNYTNNEKEINYMIEELYNEDELFELYLSYRPELVKAKVVMH